MAFDETPTPEEARAFVRRMQAIAREDDARSNPDQTHTPAFHASKSLVTADELLNPPILPEFVIDGFLPTDIGVCNGPGGGSKTTLKLFEAIHIILGKPLYGRTVLRPGSVLYVSQEDDRARLVWRLSKLIDALALTTGEKEQITKHLFIEDVSTRRLRFVEADRQGNLNQTLHTTDLLNEYVNENLSLIVFDPMVFFGPGERYVNDGGAEMMLVGRKLSSILGCSVLWVHHVGISNAREKTDDQYSGRGSSSVSDAARFVHNLWPYDARDGEKFGQLVPKSITPHEIAEKRIMVLRAPKVSHGPPITAPIWIKRTGWTFEHIISGETTQDDRERDDARKVCDFISSQEKKGIKYATNTLEATYSEVGLSRNRVRYITSLCIQKGWLIEAALDADDPFRRPNRIHFLMVGTGV